MTQEITVTTEKDIAPTAPAPELGNTPDAAIIHRNAPVMHFDAGRQKDADGKPMRRSFVSAGEHIHNEITYRGVDLFLNACLGVAFTVVTHRTELGRKWFTHPVEGFFTRAFTPLVKSAETLKNSVQWGVNFLSIMFGGTMIVPVLMALENKKNKHAIVSSLDKTIYGKDTVEKDPKFLQSYQEMDNLPKKDFWTGMGARIVALVPLIAMTLHAPTHGKLEKYWYNPIGKAIKFVGEKLGVKERGYLAQMSTHGLEAGKKASSNFDYILKIASFDVGLTAFYSVLHEISYKFFARKEDDHRIKKRERERGQPDAAPNADEAAELTPSEAALATALAQETDDKPRAQVSSVDRAPATLTAAPQLATTV